MKRYIFWVMAILGLLVVAVRQSEAGLVSVKTTGSQSGPYQVVLGGMEEDAQAYIDQKHQYNGDDLFNNKSITDICLFGLDYVQTAQADRTQPNLQIQLGLSGKRNDIYLFLDNRLGDNNRSDGPNLIAAGMLWVQDSGFVDTGADVGLDENGDGKGPGNSIDNSFSVYKLTAYTGDSITLGPQNNGTSRNMYGIAVSDRVVWVAQYDVASKDDIARAIALDRTGNIHITGDCNIPCDTMTIKYAPWGGELWKAGVDKVTYGGGVTVDRWGNVYVAGDYTGDIVTIKYDVNGLEKWVRAFDARGYSDEPTGRAVDRLGNVYVGGWSYIRFEGTLFVDEDGVLLKYDPNGIMHWVRSYDGPKHRYDDVVDLAIDRWSNVYVFGSKEDPCNFHSFMTVKHSPDGGTIWERDYTSLSSLEPIAIEVDQMGNIYLTGYCDDPITDWDYFTLKYAPDGKFLWLNHYADPGNEVPADLKVDADGNSYVTGYDSTGHDYLTVKYDPNGQIEWTRRYDGIGGLDDYANAVDLDRSGNINVTGGSRGVNSLTIGVVTIQYNPSGGVRWIELHNPPQTIGEDAQAMAVDADGQVYVTGSRTDADASTGHDFLTIKYRSNDLIAYWAMNEGKGTIAHDSARLNHGLFHGPPVWMQSRPGWGYTLEFVGNCYIDCGNDRLFDLKGQMTVMACIKVGQFDKEWQAIITKGDSAWRLSRFANTNSVCFHYNNELGVSVQVNGTINVNDGAWHHVAGVYDGTKAYLYVDGKPDGQQPGSAIATNTANVFIGENQEASGRGWKGLIDDVRIYNRALSVEEIVELSHRFDPEPLCIEYLPQDLNRDCEVNLIDLALLAEAWLKSTLVEMF